jgi:hypothetical protein
MVIAILHSIIFWSLCLFTAYHTLWITSEFLTTKAKKAKKVYNGCPGTVAQEQVYRFLMRLLRLCGEFPVICG